jgi:hypothetical protein
LLLHAKFYLDGKGDFICNQDITFIEKPFKKYPNEKYVQELCRTAFDKEPGIMNSVAIQQEWDDLAKLQYDGTTPIEAHLMRFDYVVKRLLRLDSNIEDEEFRMRSLIQLRNVRKPPALGLDGERYVGPETWMVRQVETDIDTDEKLKSALRERYGGKKKKSGFEVVDEIEELQPNWNLITLKEFFDQVQDIVGTTKVEDGFIIRAVNPKLPEDLKYELRRIHFRWMRLKFSEYRTQCEDIYDDMQYSDDSFSNGYYDTLSCEYAKRQ